MHTTNIMSTPVDSRFQFIVKNVLRDKASGWKKDYYGVPSSPWQIQTTIHEGNIASMQDTIRQNTVLMKEYTAKIKDSKTSAQEKKKLQSSINDMFTEKSNLQAEIIKENAKWIEIHALNEIFLNTARRMAYLCAKFRRDGNLDFLERGITHTYTEHYYMLDKPIPEEPLSSSAW